MFLAIRGTPPEINCHFHCLTFVFIDHLSMTDHHHPSPHTTYVQHMQFRFLRAWNPDPGEGCLLGIFGGVLSVP